MHEADYESIFPNGRLLDHQKEIDKYLDWNKASKENGELTLFNKATEEIQNRMLASIVEIVYKETLEDSVMKAPHKVTVWDENLTPFTFDLLEAMTYFERKFFKKENN